MNKLPLLLNCNLIDYNEKCSVNTVHRIKLFILLLGDTVRYTIPDTVTVWGDFKNENSIWNAFGIQNFG